MGSYHTNGHNISLQFARRFFASNVFAPCNWTAEFIGDFYPLLQKFNYQKGALVQELFQTVFAKSTEFSCVPFPPVRKNSFLPWEIENLQSIVGDGLLRLHQKAAVIHLDSGIVFGAKVSRHSSSSLLLAKYHGDVCLGEVQFFVQYAVSDGDKHSYIWVAALS